MWIIWENMKKYVENLKKYPLIYRICDLKKFREKPWGKTRKTWKHVLYSLACSINKCYLSDRHLNAFHYFVRTLLYGIFLRLGTWQPSPPRVQLGFENGLNCLSFICARIIFFIAFPGPDRIHLAMLTNRHPSLIKYLTSLLMEFPSQKTALLNGEKPS